MIIRRQRVVLRSSAKSRRRKGLAAVVVLGVLAALGARAVKDQLGKGRSPARLIPALRARAVTVDGLADPAKSEVAELFKDWKGRPLGELDLADARETLAASAPGLRADAVERNWLLRSVRLKVARRRPLARCKDSRRAATVLDDAGELYEAKDAPEDLPAAACAGTRSVDERRAMAEFLNAWGVSNGLALKTVKATEAGWELELADGTQVRWGSAEAMAAKLGRLKSVLEDGQRRFGGVRSADLRFFDQGKVLVVPAK